MESFIFIPLWSFLIAWLTLGGNAIGQRFQGEFVLAGPSGKRYRGVRTLPGQTIVFTGEKE